MNLIPQKAPPFHLWVVGILSLLWNGFGAYDYLMTRVQGADYLKTMMAPADASVMSAYIDAFPVWASMGWGLGVWFGLAGSVLLLMRRLFAVQAFAISLIGAVVGIGYQMIWPVDVAIVHQGINQYIPYFVILIAGFLTLYSRAQRVRCVLC